MKGKFNYRLLIGVLALVSYVAAAQTKDDVILTYNKGVEMANTDVKAAIEQFNLAFEMALKVGSDADDIKTLVETQIPALQFKYAGELYKAKDIPGAISNYQLAMELAEKAGDVETAGKANDIISKLYFSLGNDYYKNDNYDSALICFDNALKYDSTYAKVYLSKGILYKKQENEEGMFTAMNKAIEFGNLTNDEKTATSAGNVLRDYLLINGNRAVKAGDIKQAIQMLDQAKTYGEPKPEVYYLLAVSYNKESNWDDAINAANQGMEIEENSSEARAKFYYELGNAYLGKGENATACSSYKNALFGNYTESAKYQIETVLKCN